MNYGGMLRRSWVRHCFKCRTVAGSTSQGRAMALSSTQPLIERKYQGYFLGVKGGRYVFMCPFSRNLGPSTSWNPRVLYRDALPLPLPNSKIYVNKTGCERVDLMLLIHNTDKFRDLVGTSVSHLVPQNSVNLLND